MGHREATKDRTDPHRSHQDAIRTGREMEGELDQERQDGREVEGEDPDHANHDQDVADLVVVKGVAEPGQHLPLSPGGGLDRPKL